ncbi:MAG: nucleotidyltransferase family protein [Lentisphaeria bacterium]|jgi:predicted nucleotidyltransferase|nr:nucleotidyltransferase family protein [Lentisphaeria bacterium]MDY0175534.1 nucleotidyltransferase family protein [Lentisphaeria bacterium]NLZ60025.1 nucleotidyltransferase family protein [Lentisphaerota bacterium]
MPQLNRLTKLSNAIRQMARRHNVAKVYVFGSCARGEENAESDIDILVEPNDQASLFDFMNLQDDLENLLQSKVDLVSKRGLHPYIKDDILKEAIEL